MSLFDIVANDVSSARTDPSEGAAPKASSSQNSISHDRQQSCCLPNGQSHVLNFAENDNDQSAGRPPAIGRVTVHKLQGSEFTCENEEGVEGGEIVPLGGTGRSNYPMNEQADLIYAELKNGPVGDRSVLRLCVKLMRKHGYYTNELIALGAPRIAELLEQGVPHSGTGKTVVVKKPSYKARRILFSLQRLALRLPELGLDDINIQQRQAKLARLKLGDEPLPFNADIVRWGKLNKEERGRERGGSRAMDDSTRRVYAENCRIGLAGAYKLGLTTSTFSVKTLGQVNVAEPVFEILDELYTPAMVAAVVAAITRVNVDLYSDDAHHVANIAYLRGEAARRFPSLGISQAAVEKFDALLSDPVRFRTINYAPTAMLKRADEPGLSAHTAVCRAAAALLMRLKLDHPGLASDEAAQLDWDVHFLSIEGKMSLGLPDKRERGKTRWDPLTEEAAAMLADLAMRKKRHGMTNTLIYPNIHGSSHIRSTSAVMTQVYSEFVAAAREQLTFKEIRLLMCYRALKKHPDQLDAIAEGARYNSARALQMSLGCVVDIRRRAA